MAQITKKSIIVVEGKKLEVKVLLESLIHLDADDVLKFFQDLGLNIPRQVRIQALRTSLAAPVAKTIYDRKTLADELSYRLSFFNDYGETQLELLLPFFNDKHVNKDYLEEFWVGILGYMITRGVPEENFTKLFKRAKAAAIIEGAGVEPFEFNRKTNPIFYDLPGRIDGLTQTKFRPILFKGATLVELREVGTKYGVDVPRRIKKGELSAIILDELRERGEYTEKIEDELLKMPVVLMQRYAKDNDIKASTELKKEEVIEYILANAKETKEQYFIPSSQSVYEIIEPEPEIEEVFVEEPLYEEVETMTVFESDDDEAKELIYIEVISSPNKLEYKKNEKLDLDGMMVMAFYDNGTRKILKDSEYIVSPFDSSDSGLVEVSITFENQIGAFIVSVATSEAFLINIEVVSRPDKVTYFVGEELDLTGLAVYGTFSTGMQKAIPFEELEVSYFSSAKVGTAPIVIKHKGFISRFEVEVVNEKPIVVDIDIVSLPLKKVYAPAEEFDSTGLVVDAILETGDRVEIDKKEILLENFSNAGVGDYEVVVVYQGFEKTFSVSVEEVGPEAVSLTIEKLPYKLEYYTYDTIDLTGIEVYALLSNGNMYTVGADELDVYGFDTSTIGKQEITIVFSGKPAYFDIVMLENAQDILEIVIKSLPHKYTYGLNEDLNVSGLEVEQVFQDGNRAPVLNDRLIFTNFNNAEFGRQMVTITYGEKEAYFEIEVSSSADAAPFVEGSLDPYDETEPVDEIEQVIEHVGETVVRTGVAFADSSEILKELREINNSIKDLTKVVVLNSDSKLEAKNVDVIISESKTKDGEEVQIVISNDEFEAEVVKTKGKGKKIAKIILLTLLIIVILIVLLVPLYALLTQDPAGTRFDWMESLFNQKDTSNPSAMGLLDHLRSFFGYRP